jgi:gamma-glutamyltranspeptidase/glutathione hydrolase
MPPTSEPHLHAAGDGWAVASPHHAGSEAAAAAFADGGNAVDAALSAAAMLAVVYPNQNSVGGDLLALVGTPSGDVQFLNASGAAARAVDVDELTASRGVMPVSGAQPVTVPGAVSGWFALADGWGRLGSKGLSASLRRAAEAAGAGVRVAPGLGRDLQREQETLAADPGMRAVFFRDGRILRTGDTFRQQQLASTLTTLADSGVNAMYEGVIAESLLRFLAARGSALSAEDFAEHTVDLEPAHSVSFAGEEYVSAGANSQGVFFLEALHALEQVRQARPGGSLDPVGADAGVIATVLAHAAADRDAHCADPRFAPVPYEWLLSRERALELARLADGGPTSIPPASYGAPASGDTVAVVAADADGNWISLIQSVFHCFGAGILDPATGIVLHNRGASFSLRPGAPNRLAGGKRPLHTLMPVLVRRDGRLVGTHGAMGGRAQPQIHAHLAMHLASGRSVGEAVMSPRWVLGAMEAGVAEGGSLVRVEADVPPAAVDAMTAAGLKVRALPRWDDGAGHAQAVRLCHGVLTAAADPRSDGAALAASSSVTSAGGGVGDDTLGS